MFPGSRSFGGLFRMDFWSRSILVIRGQSIPRQNRLFSQILPFSRDLKSHSLSDFFLPHHLFAEILLKSGRLDFRRWSHI